MSEKTRCPKCGAFVLEDELVRDETPLSDFERLEIEDPPELPERHRGSVTCYARATLVTTMCRGCHEKSIN